MRVVIVLIATMAAGNAAAYIGPGLGGGLLGTLLAIFCGLFIVVGALLYYPIKAVVKKLRKNASVSENEDESLKSSVAQGTVPNEPQHTDNAKKIDDC